MQSSKLQVKIKNSLFFLFLCVAFVLLNPNLVFAQITETPTPALTETGTPTVTLTPTPTTNPTNTPTTTQTLTSTPIKTPTPKVTKTGTPTPSTNDTLTVAPTIEQLEESITPTPQVKDEKRGTTPVFAYIFIGLGVVVLAIGVFLFLKNKKNHEQ